MYQVVIRSLMIVEWDKTPVVYETKIAGPRK